MHWDTEEKRKMYSEVKMVINLKNEVACLKVKSFRLTYIQFPENCPFFDLTHIDYRTTRVSTEVILKTSQSSLFFHGHKCTALIPWNVFLLLYFIIHDCLANSFITLIQPIWKRCFQGQNSNERKPWSLLEQQMMSEVILSREIKVMYTWWMHACHPFTYQQHMTKQTGHQTWGENMKVTRLMPCIARRDSTLPDKVTQLAEKRASGKQAAC